MSNPTSHPPSTSVEDGDLAMSTEGKPVVWYRVRTTPSDGSSPVVVHRRFREFHAVDDTLKSSYRVRHVCFQSSLWSFAPLTSVLLLHVQGTALVSSFPKLPSRGVKLFTNHTSPQVCVCACVCVCVCVCAPLAFPPPRCL